MKTIETNVESKTRMTKKKMDALFNEIIQLKASKKAIEERLSELLKQAESLYKLPMSQKELISGNIYEMSKVSVNRGKNVFDPVKVRAMFDRIPVERRASLIIVKESVDANIFNSLVNEGILSNEDAESARVNAWTFYSKFGKKAGAVIKDNVITFK